MKTMAGAVNYLWTGIVHTQTNTYTAEWSSFWVFLLFGKKKKNAYIAIWFFLGCLELGSSEFFVPLFVILASPNSAIHADIVVGVRNLFVCMYLCAVIMPSKQLS